MNKKTFINLFFVLLIFITVVAYSFDGLSEWREEDGLFWNVFGVVVALFYSSFTIVGEVFLWIGVRSLFVRPKDAFNLVSNAVLALLSYSEVISSIYVYTVAGYNQTYVYIILAMIAVIIAYSIVVSVIRRITNRKKQNQELAMPEEQNT